MSVLTDTLAGNQPFIYREIKLRFDENKPHLLIPKGRVSNYVTEKRLGLVKFGTNKVIKDVTEMHLTEIVF